MYRSETMWSHFGNAIALIGESLDMKVRMWGSTIIIVFSFLLLSGVAFPLTIVKEFRSGIQSQKGISNKIARW